MLTVYSKNNCMQCKMTKKFLKDKGVSFKEINVDEDLQGLNKLISLNLSSVPLVFNEREDIIAIGFQPHKLKEVI